MIPLVLQIFVVATFLAVGLQAPHPELEAAKADYWGNRFKEATARLEAVLGSLKESADLRDTNFYLGLCYLQLDRKADADHYFQLAVEQDPSFIPPRDEFNPEQVRAFERVRTPRVGRLIIDSDPLGATVRVGKREVGKTPVETYALAGEHLVRFTLKGRSDVEKSVTVSPGGETSVAASLPGKSSMLPFVIGGGAGAGVIGVLASRSGEPDAPASAPQPMPSMASISVSVTPSPIIAEATSDPEFPWRARFTVVIRETAGLAGNVDFINESLRDTLFGFEIAPPLNIGAMEIIQRAGTNHISAGGSLSVPLGIDYRIGGGGRQAILDIAVRFTDARGNVITGTARVNIV
jgi:hypothetical protein